MSEPTWPDRDDILDLYRDQIEKFGGSYEILSDRAIDVCLARPRSLFVYEEVRDVFISNHIAG